jgi:hypothetical protein
LLAHELPQAAHDQPMIFDLRQAGYGGHSRDHPAPDPDRDRAAMIGKLRAVQPVFRQRLALFAVLRSPTRSEAS